MKKFFYFVAALVISCAAMTSCGDKAATVETTDVDSVEVVTDTVSVCDSVVADTTVVVEELVAE